MNRNREQLRSIADRYTDLTHDSRQVRPGWLFACVVGAQHDGHDFAADAVRRGATGLVVDHRLSTADLGVEHDAEVEQVVVDDVRSRLGEIAAAVYRNPSHKLRVTGITGTNGKTTTSHLLADVLNHVGTSARSIGTLSGQHTTPEAPDLQRTLAGFVQSGVDDVVMEVSSHALNLHRVDGTVFELGIFTNLGHDHLDLHGDQEQYFAAKSRLFEPQRCRTALVNADDEFGRRLIDNAEIATHRFSVSDLTDVTVGVDRAAFTWRSHRSGFRFGGEFNLSNAAAALEAARLLGHDEAAIADALQKASPVPGRFEPIRIPDIAQPTVIVDYAHTPDGIASLLAATRQLHDAGTVTIVFGCGGDRDQAKRSEMGRAAAAGADVVVLTSDNPRSESPLAIIDAIAKGIDTDATTVIVEPDRSSAIQAAIANAAPSDIVLIAGKGHEATQTLADRTIAFSDREVATAALEKLR